MPETFSPFMTPEIEELPRLACLGYVSKVGEGKDTQKKVYSMVPLELTPTESGKKGYTNLLFRPEWLEPGYNPAEMKQYETGKSMTTVYRMNIAAPSDLSVLAGISGSQENFYQLAGRLQALPEKTPAAVQGELQAFLNDTTPMIGYILKQKTQKNEETGKYDIQDGYEVGGFFYDTEEERKRLAKSAANGKIVLTFEV